MPNPKDTPNPYGHPVYKDWAKKSPEERVKGLMEAHGTASEEPRFSDLLYHSTESSLPVQLLSVTKSSPTTASCTFTFTIPAYYTNGWSNMHGAAQTLIYDNLTTLALAPVSKPGFWMLGGVSRVLDVKYLRPASVGEKVTVECEVVHVGRVQASLRGVMRDSKGRVLSTCEHDKTNIDPEVARL
ncbi:hypothetical protein E4T39_00252 [Aureobasidium subglaciale]|nr:hypothetical protein E4T39_00252 [Aureobasidium subglaciale]